MGQECNWTLRTPHTDTTTTTTTPLPARRPRQPWKASLAVVVPQHYRWTVTRDPGGCVSL